MDLGTEFEANLVDYDELVGNLIREAALFIEWSAPRLPADLLVDMTAIQRELLAWWHIRPLDQTRPLLALYARNTSNRLLHMAGLVRQS
jgi:hypothetical protein